MQFWSPAPFLVYLSNLAQNHSVYHRIASNGFVVHHICWVYIYILRLWPFFYFFVFLGLCLPVYFNSNSQFLETIFCHNCLVYDFLEDYTTPSFQLPLKMMETASGSHPQPEKGACPLGVIWGVVIGCERRWWRRFVSMLTCKDARAVTNSHDGKTNGLENLNTVNLILD